jgi:hypothetical protein
VDIEFSQHHLLKRLSVSPMHVLGSFVEYQKFVGVWVCVCSIGLPVSFVLVLCFFLITMLLQYSFKSGIVIPALLFLLQIDLAIQGQLWFHMNFRIGFSISEKNVIVILMGISLNI